MNDWVFVVLAFGIPLWVMSDTLLARRRAGRLLLRCGLDSWWVTIGWTVLLFPFWRLPSLVVVSCLGWLGVVWLPVVLGAAEIRENGLIHGNSFVPWKNVRSTEWKGDKLVVKTSGPMGTVITFRVPEASRGMVQSALAENVLAVENPKAEGAGSLNANAAD